MDGTDPAETQRALAAGIELIQQAWEHFTLLDVGVILITIGVIAAARVLLRSWIKRKGFRMVLKDRNDKIHAMWLDIIQDGIDDRVEKQLISNAEAKKMFDEAMVKMGLTDLVPKKRLAPHVKERLKREKYLREQAREKGEYQERVPVPGGPPTPIVREKFSRKVGNAAKFFNRKNAA